MGRCAVPNVPPDSPASGRRREEVMTAQSQQFLRDAGSRLMVGFLLLFLAILVGVSVASATEVAQADTQSSLWSLVGRGWQ